MDAPPRVRFKVKQPHKDALTRILSEAIWIESDSNLNSKCEWGGQRITRLVVDKPDWLKIKDEDEQKKEDFELEQKIEKFQDKPGVDTDAVNVDEKENNDCEDYERRIRTVRKVKGRKRSKEDKEMKETDERRKRLRKCTEEYKTILISPPAVNNGCGRKNEGILAIEDDMRCQTPHGY